MRYTTQPSFWGLFVIGWLVSLMVLGLLARVMGLFGEISTVQTCVIGAGFNVLALIYGFAFARAQLDG